MLAFIHIEKAAGSTISSILRRSYGLRHAEVCGWRNAWSTEDDLVLPEDLERTRWIFPALQSIAGHGVKPYAGLERVCPGIRYYTFLREPLDRCASHFQFQIQVMKKRVSFEQWIRTAGYRNFQTQKLTGGEDAAAAIEMLEQRIEFVGLMERFNESLVMLRRRFPDEPLDICYRAKNVATDSSIKKQLLDDTASRELLVQANQEDCKLYDYVRKALYPRQQRQYGESLAADVLRFQEANRTHGSSRQPLLPLLVRHLVFRPAVRLYSGWHRRHAA
jgi:hypothetical protein